MKKLFYPIVATLLLLLSACGDIDEKNDREVQSQQSDEIEHEEEKEVKEEEEEKEEEKEKAIGTRSNPLPFGDAITVKRNIYDDSFNGYEALLELTLLETIRGEEAWAIIQSENQFNDPADDGFEHVLIKVKGFLKEAETDDDSLFFSSFDFKFVSDDGEVYDFKSAVIPDELQKELYNGGTGEGYIHGQVKKGDEFKVSYNSSEGSPVFFFVE